MSKTVRVALLFDDDNLAAPLRQALQDGGAQIVHEGPLSQASRATLLQSGAEVVVINLHDDDDALVNLHEIIDGERPRVVFNEAAASQRLDGWDRARWARHLAAKVLAQADVDPPRPGGAPDPAAASRPLGDASNAMPASSPAAPSLTSIGEESESLTAELERLLAAELQAPSPSNEERAPPLTPLALDDGEAMMRGDAQDLSATLADELAGLLANDTAASFEEVTARPPVQASPRSAETVFAWDVVPSESVPAAPSSTPVVEGGTESAAPAPAVESPRFTLDHLQLVALDDEVSQPPPRATTASDEGAVRQAPAEWGLLDDDAPLAQTSAPSSFAAGGMEVESMDALELLAPSVDIAASASPPGLSLELVSLGESIAEPASSRAVHYEMVLDTEAAALRWLVVLGAAADATPAVAAFLAALPTMLPVLLVHTQQHQDSQALLRELSANSTLPVRLASHGSYATRGEVLLVPPGQSMSLRRDGRVELQPVPDAPPSIDASFSMAAQVFGAAALAIVFSGRGNDGVAGAQAVHDRGGRVWVEEVMQASSADMVSGVQAERLAGFSGTPAQLAARLSEEYAMEIRR
jgi:chemosensory pili system protein ChpB (putative protein-glutamate methylesterase)